MFPPLALTNYGISDTTGYLPAEPLPVPTANPAWHHLAADLPKQLLTGYFRQRAEALPPFERAADHPEVDMRTVSYLGHAYLWGGGAPPARLPARLADAWVQAAERVGRPPILSYPSYCLYNWQRHDPTRPPLLGNIRIVQNFLGGADEDWFILIHVDIEARAAAALRAIPDTLAAVHQSRPDAVADGLRVVADALAGMNATLRRMPEHCDPYIYYTRVRPYIFGTKNNPSLPQGLVYEGHFDNQPQQFRGETGAQSSIVPALDALLGVAHVDDPLKAYLLEMRDYMVPAHRRFIEAIEATGGVRTFVEAHPNTTGLANALQTCYDELHAFRSLHLEYAASYIHKQGLQSHNSTEVGTGGTPFMAYLAKHRDETRLETRSETRLEANASGRRGRP